MNKIESTFIINLIKTTNGYTFQSVTESQGNSSKKKNSCKDKPKNNSSNKQIHRIFRQLALDPQQPEQLLISNIQESQNIRKNIQPEIQEEFSVQIKRDTGLPISPATWFHEEHIHQIQINSLPEFFDARNYKTPALYKIYRNFIVTLYRKNPYQYLTKIACRRTLRGDVNTIMKIHTFLQKQGVINFCISKQGNYTFIPSIFSNTINQPSKYGIAIDKFIDSDQQKTNQPIDITNITITNVNKYFSKSNRVFCMKCQSICGLIWYKTKNQNQKFQILCINCYQNLNQKQMEQYIRIDIIKKIDTNTTQDNNKSMWSVNDNLKLLNFLSENSKSWQKLEQSFQKKKSFDDVMLQFMLFPIGNFDPYQDKPIKPLISDNFQNYANKLVKRFKDSSYNKINTKSTSKNEYQQNITNSTFTKNMTELIKKLSTKFETTIKTNLQIQNLIDSSLSQIVSLTTLSKKKIQDQITFSDQKNMEKSHQFVQRSQSSNSRNDQQQYNDNDRQENIKDVYLEDYINNFSYN